ncbi:MAG TPA: PKD domain-containing protein [Cyclobacteriaceae bacterium]
MSCYQSIIYIVLINLISVLKTLGGPGDDIVFIENKGQWDKDIKFAADIPQGKLFITGNKLIYTLLNQDPKNRSKQKPLHSKHIASQDIVGLEVILNENNSSPKISARGRLKTVYNYYLTNNPDQWGENCRGYSSLKLINIYPSIDLKLYSHNNRLKYDFIVAPNADPAQIKLKYPENINIRLFDDKTIVKVGNRKITENQPLAYQIRDNGSKYEVNCHFKLTNKHISFKVDDDYNSKDQLVIDPELIFSTFSGSRSDNFGYTACFDDSGNLYSGGIVFGPQFPATTADTFGGATDMAILKYDSTGSDLLYATFIGGEYGETPHSLIVNNNDELVIMGTSGSPNYPTSLNAYDRTYNGGRLFNLFGTYEFGTDIVVTKLDRLGRLNASTFIGSPGNDGILKMLNINNYQNLLIYNYGDYQRGDVIVDEENNIYVATSTDTAGFPVNSGIQPDFMGGNSDAVVFSFDDDLSQLRWSSYLGGQQDDAAYSIKLTNDGKVLVGGGTVSSDFPSTSAVLDSTYNGAIDGFITMIDTESDSVVKSTFLGTNSYDQVYFIDIDQDQNIYATGQTRGNYPVTSGVFTVPNSAQFIHKLSPDLNNTIFSTVFGSGELIPNISPTAFLANECENIFLSGWGGDVNINNAGGIVGNTLGMTITRDALFPSTDGSDFYLMNLSADGTELLYATFFGSTNSEGDHVDGGTSRFDKRGIVYQSVCSCGGSDDNFPTTEGAWSTVNRGVNNAGVERCNNVAFKFDLASLDARFITTDSLGGNEGITTGCAPFKMLFVNTSIGGQEFFWDFDDGKTSEEPDSVIHTFENGGVYNVTLKIRDDNTCTVEDITSKTIRIFDDRVSVQGSGEICPGDEIQFNANGGIDYQWAPNRGLSNPTLPNPVASPDSTTVYAVSITTPNGCVKQRFVSVIVKERIEEDFEVIPDFDDCSGDLRYKIENSTRASGVFLWDFGDGNTSSEDSPTHTFENTGTYTINLETSEDCILNKAVEIYADRIYIPNAFSPNNDGINDVLEIKSPFTTDLTILDRNGKVVYNRDNYANDWDGGDLPSGVYYYAARFLENGQCNGWIQLFR